MEFRQLRYFIALAQESSFTSAAKRLNISQPPLSQQIKLLEEELGAKLVNRLPRGIELTDAGTTFLAHAQELLERAKKAQEETIQQAVGLTGTVRIAMATSAMFSTLPDVISILGQRPGAIRLKLTESSSHSQIGSLQRGEVDLGVMRLISPPADLEVHRIYSEPLYAVVASAHRLSRSRKLSLTELAEEDFVFPRREVSPANFDFMLANCVRAGFSPAIMHTASHLATVLQIVRMGFGVSIVPSSARRLGVPDVRFIPIDDSAMPFDMFVAHKKGALRANVAKVKEALLATTHTR